MGLIGHRYLCVHRRYVDDGPRRAEMVATQESPDAQPRANHVDAQMALEITQLSFDNRASSADTSAVHQAGQLAHLVEHPIPGSLIGDVQQGHVGGGSDVGSHNFPAIGGQYSTGLRTDSRCPAGHQHPTRHQRLVAQIRPDQVVGGPQLR